ncbi:tetratricopeptide repeat protein [Leptolyngbya ohadii]|uniref:tetratricopeptide repeat protein n=1 Tax=Leptolyngbya ohadii TaxID=1962290 RepID=UPI000B59B085|nr:tetratricopeptide repeat protein [Leptolyngbya ohadii]
MQYKSFWLGFVSLYSLCVIGGTPAQAQDTILAQSRVSPTPPRTNPPQATPLNCCPAENTPRARDCRTRNPNARICPAASTPVYSSSGSRGLTQITAEQLIQIGIAIAQGRATANDYNVLAYVNAVQGNSIAAETRYRQAIDLAQQQSDGSGEAIAREGLGNVLRDLDRTSEALPELTRASELYRGLGNTVRFNQIQQQVRDLPQFRDNPQLAPQFRPQVVPPVEQFRR